MAVLSRDKVIEVVGRGRLDDHQVVEIIATGATEAELVEAFTRTVARRSLGAETRRAPSARVLQLCEILESPEDMLEEEDL